MTTYFPELKVRARWNVGTSSAGGATATSSTAVLDEQIAATRADPGSPSARTSWPCSCSARDEDGEGLGRRRPARRAAGPHRRRPRDDGGRDRLGRRAARRTTRRRSRARGAAPPATATTPISTRWSRRSCASARPCRAPPSGSLDEPFAIGGHTVPPGTAILVDGWGAAPRPRRCSPSPDAPAPRALPRRRARALHLAALRRRRAPLHRRGARRARDQGRAEHDAAARRPRAGHARPRARGAPRPDDGPARGRARAGGGRGGPPGAGAGRGRDPLSDRPISGAPAARHSSSGSPSRADSAGRPAGAVASAGPGGAEPGGRRSPWPGPSTRAVASAGGAPPRALRAAPRHVTATYRRIRECSRCTSGSTSRPSYTRNQGASLCAYPANHQGSSGSSVASVLSSRRSSDPAWRSSAAHRTRST